METSCVWWIGGNTFRSMADKIGFFHLLTSDGNLGNQAKLRIYELFDFILVRK